MRPLVQRFRYSATDPWEGHVPDRRLWARHAVPLQRKGHAAGMTLIEIMVAVALLGLLSAGIFTAFQVGTSSWQSARTG